MADAATVEVGDGIGEGADSDVLTLAVFLTGDRTGWAVPAPESQAINQIAHSEHKLMSCKNGFLFHNTISIWLPPVPILPVSHHPEIVSTSSVNG